MAKAAQNIVLSPSRDIPLRQARAEPVQRAAHQGWRLGRGTGRGHRAARPAAELERRPVLDADGVETGMFEIPAGGRRFQALSLLVKQKRLAKTAPIPASCGMRVEILAEDDSLAENMQRVALHPLDQFRAFQALREKGSGRGSDCGGLLSSRRRSSSSA